MRTGNPADTKPKNAKNLDSPWMKLYLWPATVRAPLRRRGFVHVIWLDPSKRVRNYLAPMVNNQIIIPQAGPAGQTFHVPVHMDGMGWDDLGFPVGLWANNEPQMIPMIPGTRVSAVSSQDLYQTMRNTLWLLSAQEPSGLKKIGTALTFMLLVGLGIAGVLILSGVKGIVPGGP